MWWGSAEMRDFWPLETRRVKERYPAFELRDRPPRPNLDPDDAQRCGPIVRTWRGKMQPFLPTLSDDELAAIISDLHEGPALDIDLNGSLRHSDSCPRREHPLPPDRRPQGSLSANYEVEVAYAVPPARPIVRGLRPRLTVQQYPEMPQPIAPLGALCVANAPTDPWDLYSDGAVLYLHWTAYYLAKHTLWLERFQRTGESVWPGRARPGDPDDEIKNNPPDAPCTCNSGIAYRDCHLTFDLENSRRQREGQPRWTRPMNMAFYEQARQRARQRGGIGG